MSFIYSFGRILGLLTGLSIFSICAVYFSLKFESPSTISQQITHVGESLEQKLDNEHTKNLETIKKTFAIPDEQWEDAFKKLETLKAQDTLVREITVPLPDTKNELIKRAQEILESYSIDPNRVTITLIDKPQSGCDACAGQTYSKDTVYHFLQINVPRLSHEPIEVQKALLKHETIHLLKHDSLEQMFLENLLEKNGITKQMYQSHPSFTTYCKQIEMRADLLAADDIETAQAFNKAFELHLKQYPENPNKPQSMTHPTTGERQHAMNTLLHTLQNEKQTYALA